MEWLVADISKYQKKIDFKKFKASNLKGCIIRLGYRGYASSGTLVTDEYFKEYIKSCNDNDIPFGVYFFSQAKTVAEAIEEADYTIKTLEATGYKPLFPIYIDTEKSSHPLGMGRADKLTKAERTKVVKAFCDRVEELGYYAGIYASTYWFRDNLNDSELTKYDHWVADYRGYCGYKGNYGMWQFSSTVKYSFVSGTSGKMDTNKCYRDYPSIIKKRGLNGWKVEEPIKLEVFETSKMIDEATYKKFKTLADTLKVGIIPTEHKYYTFETSEMSKGDIEKFRNLAVSTVTEFTIKEK